MNHTRPRTSRRLRSAGAAALIVALMLSWAGLRPPPRSIDIAPVSHYQLTPHAIQFNAFGGSGNAFSNFNTKVASTSSNNVWTRLIARNNNAYTVSLNELCVTQFFIIAVKMSDAGYNYGYGWQAAINSTQLNDDCGDQYGNLAMVVGGASQAAAGGQFAAQKQGQPPGREEYRTWVCVRNIFFWSCSTHFHPAAAQYNPQSAEYADIIAFLAGNGDMVFGAGDFNYNPLQLAYFNYTFNKGFVEADQTQNRATLDNQSALAYKIDYIFRKNPAAWSAHPAYILQESISDHKWLQGYL